MFRVQINPNHYFTMHSSKKIRNITPEVEQLNGIEPHRLTEVEPHRLTEVEPHSRASEQQKQGSARPKILNYLKSQNSDLFIEAVHIAMGAGGIDTTSAKNVLSELEKEGIAFRDPLDKEKWKLTPTGRSSKLEETEKQDINLTASEETINSSSSLLLLPSDKTPSSSENDLKENTYTNGKKKIKITQRARQYYAQVEDLEKHPKNAEIYTGDNLAYLLPLIEKNRVIKPLEITSYGRIIDGHTRYDCALKLKIKEVEVYVRDYPSEREETEALLIRNQYRQKCNEEIGREILEWEDIETEKAKQRQSEAAKATNKKLDRVDKDDNTLVALVPQACGEDNQQKKTPRVRKIVADKFGFGEKKTSWLKNSTQAIKDLKKCGYHGAAEDLSRTLNKQSAKAAQDKVNKLKKIKKTMEDLSKNSKNSQFYQELELILKNKDIKAAELLSEQWKLERKSRDKCIEVGDVVKIVNEKKAYVGQWGVVISCSDSREFNCDVMVHQEDLKGMYKASLRLIELSEPEKKEARGLMHRLRKAWKLSENYPDEPGAKAVLKSISTRNLPTQVSKLDKSFLSSIENQLKEF